MCLHLRGHVVPSFVLWADNCFVNDNHIQKGLMLISSERGRSLKSRFVPKSELLETFSTFDTVFFTLLDFYVGSLHGAVIGLAETIFR